MNQMVYARTLDSTLLSLTPRGDVLNARTGLTKDGDVVNFGSSFMLALEFGDDGPHAEALLAYSQSADARSPHAADQTHLFSEKRWRPVLFREEDIAADPDLQAKEIRGAR